MRLTCMRLSSRVGITLLAAVLAGLLAPAQSETEGSEVSMNESIADILQNHSRCTKPETERSFPGPTLVYVTPWNSQGYDITKRFGGCKFDYVAPVWYQLRSSNGILQLTGRHDVDQEWMAAVRRPCPEGGRRAKILPRVLLELAPADVGEVLHVPDDMARMLSVEADTQGFDGWVLEAWSYFGALGVTSQPLYRRQALEAVQMISEALQMAEGKELFMAVSPPVAPPGRPAQFSLQDAADLLPLVSGLSVMTYDYSLPNTPGPNAPAAWVRSNAEALAEMAAKLPGSPLSKILLGLHFYGNEYRFVGKKLVGHEAVVGSAFIQRLQEQQAQSGGDEAEGEAGSGLTVQWVDKSQEPVFKWRTEVEEGPKAGRQQRHFMYYPTQQSLALRVATAAELGLGVSVWEVGQGLGYFYDLL